MIRVVLAAVLTIAAGPAAPDAETVRVRSGEHADFSRLVFEFPERPDWTLSLGPGRATIVFKAGEWSFQTENVFRFIPRTRIRTLSEPASGVLILELGCDCSLDVFAVRRGALVIDVKDDPAPVRLENVFPTARERETPASSATLLQVPPTLSDPLGPSIIDLPLASRPDRPPAARDGAVFPVVTVEPGDAPDGHPADSAGDGVGLVTRSLAEEIGRAASSGLLRLAPMARDRPATGKSSGPGLVGGALPGVRFRLPGDDAGPASTDADRPSLQYGTCPAEAAFDVASWIPAEGAPAEALAAARKQLFGELDRADDQAALALARLYIALGFGAEADAVLRSTLANHPDTDRLSGMARLLDGTVSDGNLLGNLQGCPGRAQLWSLLADPEDNGHHAEAVLVALSELPLHLRRLLGPRVSAALEASGDMMSAASVRHLVQRAPGPHGVPVELWEAQDQAKDGSREGFGILATLATGASPVSAEALASYLELTIAARDLPETAFVSLAEARAQELRDTQLGARLVAALIRTHLLRGDFAAAYARLTGAAEVIDEARFTRLREEFLSALTRDGDDTHFLRFGANAVKRRTTGIAAGTALLAARRMAELGFGRLARDYLHLAPDGDERRLLSARIALDDSDVAAALEHLWDFEGDEADEMRAKILSRAGHHAEAADLFERTGAATRARMAIWLSGDWDRIAAAADSTRAQAAELMSEGNRPDTRDPAALLARSEDARSRLENLLTAIPPP